MTGTLAVGAIAIRVTGAPLAPHRITPTAPEAPPIPPRPPTTKTNLLTTGCLRGFLEHTTLDIRNLWLSQTLPPSPPSPVPPQPSY